MKGNSIQVLTHAFTCFVLFTMEHLTHSEEGRIFTGADIPGNSQALLVSSYLSFQKLNCCLYLIYEV